MLCYLWFKSTLPNFLSPPVIQKIRNKFRQNPSNLPPFFPSLVRNQGRRALNQLAYMKAILSSHLCMLSEKPGLYSPDTVKKLL